MTFKDLDALIITMEKEHEAYVRQTEQRIKTLKDEVEKLRQEYAKEVNPDEMGIRDFIVERAQYYFGDKFIIPEASPELMDEFYEDTKRKVKPKEVVIVIDQQRIRSKAKKKIDNSTYEKIFFCNDAFYVMGNSEIALMYRYDIIDAVDAGMERDFIGHLSSVLDIKPCPQAKEGKDYIKKGINGLTGGSFYIMSAEDLKLLKKFILDIVDFVNEQK